MTKSTLFSEIDPSGRALLTINRPEVHNAFDDALVVNLMNELRHLEANDKVRVVLLASSGKTFCAGADLTWMRRAAAFGRSENLAGRPGAGRAVEDPGPAGEADHRAGPGTGLRRRGRPGRLLRPGGGRARGPFPFLRGQARPCPGGDLPLRDRSDGLPRGKALLSHGGGIRESYLMIETLIDTARRSKSGGGPARSRSNEDGAYGHCARKGDRSRGVFSRRRSGGGGCETFIPQNR